MRALNTRGIVSLNIALTRSGLQKKYVCPIQDAGEKKLKRLKGKVKEMIFSTIRTWRKEEKIYTEKLQKALTFLENMDLESVRDEKFVLEEDQIFGFVTTVETEEKDARRPESHEKHLDIQFLIEGREKIGYLRKREGLQIVSDELEKKDICFYDGNLDGEIFLDLNPGDFVVLFPEDIHRPQCSGGENRKIRKCVIKIRMDE